MRIKRLDITGFKSFMERSIFQFDDGVTGVVGPNGCGKSNVVDAIRWVMGEQSAKNLRGRGMEDVIFNGSESKSPLSMAEVSLTFKVTESDSLAPVYAGFSEITVTRRLFRSGESEYLINKTQCRLLDIVELFLGTGVGTKAYSIIEQGRVGLIVSSKPEDRRALIEEAAGITKYKARRKAAERKMEFTQQNLLRVTDIVTELEKRLESLQRQAKKAEKYKKVRAEMKEIELHVAALRMLELTAEAKMHKARLENLSGEEKEGLDRLRTLEEEISVERAAIEAEQKALEEGQGKAHALASELLLAEQNLAHWKADAEATAKRLESSQAERDALTAKQAEVQEGLHSREAELAALGTSWKDDEVKMNSMEDELRRAAATEAELKLRLEDERQKLMQLASRLANHESNLAGLARQKADLEARIAKVKAESDVLREDEAKLERARTDAAKTVASSRQMALELAERRGQEEESLARTRAAFAENEIKVISLREELSDKRSRLSSLEEIQRNYEGYDRGVRAVMLKAGNEPKAQGIFGLVADVLAANPRFEKAIEAALGERLQHVVVESKEKGFELVRYLKESFEGRSTFLPAAVSPKVPVMPPDLTRNGVLAWAFSEVKYEEALTPLVEVLLGDVVIVEDVEVARSYAASGGEGYTLVTLDGEVCRPDGAVTGGVLEGPAVGALQKKREISELSEEIRGLEERYNETLTRHYALQKQMGHTEGVLKGLAKNVHAEELNLATQEKDLHRAGEDLSRVRERLSALVSDEGSLGTSLAGLAAEEEASRGEVAQGQTDRERREELLRQLSAELDTSKHRSEALLAEHTTLRVKVAASNERNEGARKELEGLLLQRAENEERILRLQSVIGEAEVQLSSLRGRVDETETRLGPDREALAALEADLSGRKVRHEASAEAVKEKDQSLRELRGKMDSVTQGVSQISLKERELSLELAHLQEGIRERHQVELAHELSRFHLVAPPAKENEAKLKELRAQVEKMGEINLTAIEEHQELDTRFQFLSNQKKDLEASIEQLKEAIQTINKTSRERFSQAFEIINEKFQQVFPRLFGGGRAGLLLTEEGPDGEQGVEIVAQPPGKKLGSVNLFSGGEKALTAVALIFAIFLIKPTPFCLLDEVDAPLDEANVGRYNEMVKEMSKGSQFILITHNKRTMEVADTLYGVTMEEPGVSKLVSVKISDAVAKNEAPAGTPDEGSAVA